MKYKLEELDVGEVSFVDKAANKRKFLLIKSEGGQDMPKAEVILNCDEGREELLKSVAELDDASLVEQVLKSEDLQAIMAEVLSDTNTDELRKAGISDKAMKAVKMALAALKGVKEELPADIMRKLAALGGYAYPEKKAGPDMKDGEKDKDKMAKSFGGYTIVKSEDGTVDFSNIPDDVRPLVKSMWYENEAARKDADEAKRIAKEERDARVLKEFISKAESLTNLSIDALHFGPILKSLSETLDSTQYDEIERVLKAADAAVAEAEILTKEMGKSGSDEVDSNSAYGKLTKAANKIKESESISFEQAFVKALDLNPDLAAQEREERTK